MGGGWRPNLQLTGWRRFEQVLLVSGLGMVETPGGGMRRRLRWSSPATTSRAEGASKCARERPHRQLFHHYTGLPAWGEGAGQVTIILAKILAKCGVICSIVFRD